MPKPRYKWFHNVRRYRDPRGRFVASKTIRRYVGEASNAFAEDLRAQAKKLIADFSAEEFAKFSRESRELIKEMHNAFTIIALGGKESAVEFSTKDATVWQF